MMDGPKLLRDFKNLVSPLLLRVQGAKVHAPCLDQIVVEPLRCDPMITVAPPPRILTYSDLEGFLSAQRIRTLLLLRSISWILSMLVKALYLLSLISLKVFSIPRAPCISGVVSNSDRRSTTIDGSQKLRGPNMHTLYQRVRPLQFGKCSLYSSLIETVDLLACRDQRQG